MAEFSQDQIEALWFNNGGLQSAARIASAIAMAESGGNSGIVNNYPATGDFSIGLWQINYFDGLGPERTREYGTWQHLAGHPADQARAAIGISGDGSNWTAWSTYNNGHYLAFMDGHHAAGSTGVNLQGLSGVWPNTGDAAWLEWWIGALGTWANLEQPAMMGALAQTISMLNGIG